MITAPVDVRAPVLHAHFHQRLRSLRIPTSSPPFARPGFRPRTHRKPKGRRQRGEVQGSVQIRRLRRIAPPEKTTQPNSPTAKVSAARMSGRSPDSRTPFRAGKPSSHAVSRSDFGRLRFAYRCGGSPGIERSELARTGFPFHSPTHAAGNRAPDNVFRLMQTGSGDNMEPGAPKSPPWTFTLAASNPPALTNSTDKRIYPYFLHNRAL